MGKTKIEGISRTKAVQLTDYTVKETVKAVSKAVIKRWGWRLFTAGFLVGIGAAALIASAVMGFSR